MVRSNMKVQRVMSVEPFVLQRTIAIIVFVKELLVL